MCFSIQTRQRKGNERESDYLCIILDQCIGYALEQQAAHSTKANLMENAQDAERRHCGNIHTLELRFVLHHVPDTGY